MAGVPEENKATDTLHKIAETLSERVVQAIYNQYNEVVKLAAEGGAAAAGTGNMEHVRKSIKAANLEVVKLTTIISTLQHEALYEAAAILLPDSTEKQELLAGLSEHTDATLLTAIDRYESIRKDQTN